MNRVNGRNITLAIIILLILVVVALLIGKFTYSYLGADIGEDVRTQGETTASGDTLIFSSGNQLTLQATTDNFNATSGNLTATTNPAVRLIASGKTNNATATYNAGVIIKENTYSYSSTNETAEVILTVRDETGTILQSSSDNLEYVTVNGVSGFDITGVTGAINIVRNHPISTTSSTTGETHTWTFTITFVNLEIDQSINENATLDMDVILQRDEIIYSLAYHIQSLYTNDGENSLYYHDGEGSYTNASEEAGDNSYRYSGANPDNYVCFGSDAETCPEENLYRIIGVFDGKVKLIKNTSIGTYVWDDYDNGNYSNVWSTSDIKTTLNETYYNTLGTNWQNVIETTRWQLITGSDFYGYLWNSAVQTTYNNEIRNNSGETDEAKIGLIYVSDYGYAASPENWTSYLLNPQPNNWLNVDEYWTISAVNNDSDVYVVGGPVTNDAVIDSYSVLPVFYLNSSVTYSSGTGTSTDPFRINI